MSEASPDGATLRAMVLAAGLGTRLRPLTELLPKPLVPVLGVPLVEGTLDLLAQASVARAVVNLHHLAPVLRDALERMRGRLALALELVEETTILGTGGGLRNAASRLRGARAVLLVNGDTLLAADLAAMVRDHLASGAAATLLVRPNPDPVAYAPVLTDPALRVHRIAGLPAGPQTGGLTSWMFAGVHVLDPRVLDDLPEGASDVNRALHPRLIARGELVRAFPFDGLWSDVGTPERLLGANLRALAAPPARLLARAVRDGHALHDGRLYGARTDVARDAVVRDSVVGHGARIGTGATVERSLLFPGVEVEDGARVLDSVLGPLAAAAKDERLERVFAVGDRRLAMGAAE